MAYSGYLYTLDESDLPALKNGDLIFQTTAVPGAMAIGLASGSLYIHTGIIKQTRQGAMVIHAAQFVTETPLSEWIDQGVLRRFAVFRYKGLGDSQAKDILERVKAYYGRPYDHFFSFDNDTIYCSELEYLAFRDAGVPLATVEKIGSLYINNRFVRDMIEQRWKHYPPCTGKAKDFESCYQMIMDGDVVTPASVARDSRLERMFTNYPL